VKQLKTSLEKASKLSRVFKMELAATDELIAELHSELMRRDGLKISKDVESEFNWIQVRHYITFCLTYMYRYLVLFSSPEEIRMQQCLLQSRSFQIASWIWLHAQNDTHPSLTILYYIISVTDVICEIRMDVLLLCLLFSCIAHFYFIIVLFFLLKSCGFHNLLLKQSSYLHKMPVSSAQLIR